MEKWPIGVFASIDAGLGVRLEVARELNVPTIHLHTPHRESRTPQRAEEFLQRLKKLDITVTVVFAGFEGESYADIPTVSRTVGLVPKETRRERTVELKEIADFAKQLGVDKVGVHIGFVPHDRTMNEYRDVLAVARDKIRLGITTPREVPVFRKEVYLSIKDEGGGEDTPIEEALDSAKKQ